MTQKVTIIATIGADRDKVWKYWNTPEHIMQWNFASNFKKYAETH